MISLHNHLNDADGAVHRLADRMDALAGLPWVPDSTLCAPGGRGVPQTLALGPVPLRPCDDASADLRSLERVENAKHLEQVPTRSRRGFQRLVVQMQVVAIAFIEVPLAL
jgi:hypothetical protein